MMYTIVAVSDSDKHFDDAIKEYKKRLGKSLSFVNLKPCKDKNHNVCIQKETELVLEELSKSKYEWWLKIMLSKDGEAINTEKLLKKIKNQNVVFVIWGPYGLDEESVRKQAKFFVNFWIITMPHGLVKLVIVEQIYRMETIKSGKKYHY